MFFFFFPSLWIIKSTYQRWWLLWQNINLIRSRITFSQNHINIMLKTISHWVLFTFSNALNTVYTCIFPAVCDFSLLHNKRVICKKGGRGCIVVSPQLPSSSSPSCPIVFPSVLKPQEKLHFCLHQNVSLYASPNASWKRTHKCHQCPHAARLPLSSKTHSSPDVLA